MKIGLTTTSFRTDQGAERFVVNLTKGLLQADQEVHVVGRLEHKKILEEFYDNLVPKQQFKFHFHRVRTIKAHRYPNLLTYAWGVHRILKNLPLDVTQGFGKSLGIDIFRPPTATYKSFISETKPNIKSRQAAKLELYIERRILLQEAKAIIVNSNIGAKALRRAYPDLTAPIRVIYNMIDLEKWQLRDKDKKRQKLREKFGIPQDACVFLHVSTNFKLKGIPEALEALQLLRQNTTSDISRKVFYLLVGEGGFKVPNELKDQVMVFPQTSDIQPYYQLSDVLLHPTKFDSFANVVLEAFASEMPVITSKMNGAFEVVKNNIDGTVLSDIEPATIQKSLMQYMDNQQLMKMKAAALSKANEFSIESITGNFIDLYEAVQKRLSGTPRQAHLRPLKPLLAPALNL